MRLLKESCSCSFSKELKKWHISVKTWVLLIKYGICVCSLENNYLMGIYISFNNDIIQGELFTIKLLSFSFCHPLYW